LCNAPTKKCSDSFVLTSVGLLLLFFFFSNYGLDKLFFGFLTIQNISIKLFKNNLDPFIINFTVKINNFNHQFTWVHFKDNIHLFIMYKDLFSNMSLENHLLYCLDRF
jgi:hypothetical protein